MSKQFNLTSHWLKIGLSVFVALFVSLVAHAATDPSGLWKWNTPGRNGLPGRVLNLRLKVDGDSVTGALITPNRTNDTFAEVEISDGKVNGDTLTFSVVRTANNGNKIISKYNGRIGDDEIVGTIENSRRNGAPGTPVEWRAERNKTGQLIAGPKVVLRPGYDENGYKSVNETHYKEISPDDAEKFLKEHADAIILDLRTPDEYAEGHLPNAKNYNVTDENNYKSVLAPLDKSKWYVVHSAVGHYRTVRALEYFEANGFEHVVAIDGGYQAWSIAGKPTEK